MGILTVTPLEDPASYDRMVLGDITTPGICELVGGGERPYKWDQKETAGAQGVTTTYRGWRPSDGIRFKFKLWTAALIQAFFRDVYPVIAIDGEKQEPKPYSVYYPTLFANDIFWLITDKIGPLTDEGKQLWTVTVEFKEFRQAKPKNVTTTPDTATSTAGNPKTKPTARDQQDEEIERLRREFAKPF
jgi:hypothetical protein